MLLVGLSGPAVALGEGPVPVHVRDEAVLEPVGRHHAVVGVVPESRNTHTKQLTKENSVSAFVSPFIFQSFGRVYRQPSGLFHFSERIWEERG